MFLLFSAFMFRPISLLAISKDSATQKSDCHGVQAVERNRGGMRSGDARQGAAN